MCGQKCGLFRGQNARCKPLGRYVVMTWRMAARGQRSDVARIACGEAGTCPRCRYVIGVRIPKAGDGSVRVMRRHNWKCDRFFGVCPGHREPAVEWSPRAFPVTDPVLDAPDGAVVDGYERRGDRWVPVP